MQIVDLFHDEQLKISFPLERKELPWDISDTKYAKAYLHSLFHYADEKRRKRRVYTVYDLCMDLDLEPKTIYIYMGWGENDEIQIDPYVDEKRIIIGFNCKFL